MASQPGSLSRVRRVILILSGKGGVGKSTVCSQLALSLRARGNKVGVLDVDLCGPSIPKILGVDGKDIHQCPEGWVPVFTDEKQTLAVMSIAFLLSSNNDAVVWRGPKKNGMIKQFIEDVYWQELDYLLVDTPPGTSDEHISTVEALKKYVCDGAILVTTPQNISVGDVRRELTFCRKMGIKILGIVENMSGFVCPHCSECSNVFSKGGGEGLAKEQGVPFLGCIPLDQNLTKCLEKGSSFVDAFPTSGAKSALDLIVDRIMSE